MLLEKVFGKTGANVFHAFSGKEAIEIMKNSNKDICVAIIDILMPGLSGYEVVEVLNKQFSNTKFCAYTADILRIDVERCMKAGFHKLFFKPILPIVLLNEIDNMIFEKNKITKKV
jgi:CheY-like chemotaxis protein